MYLEHLSISGFRGVGDQLDLPLTHRTIIYGPNGSGKSSILQAIAWALYGKLPLFSGGVFTREDALVNDFLDNGKAEVVLTLSGGKIIRRQRNKRNSTGAGATLPTLSFLAADPQAAIEQLLGLNQAEFFAAVFLHQETIRDFLTTTSEERSATIDRMIGTHLLRTLIKSVDPSVPDKAIKEAQKAIERIDSQLSQAAVINREVIQKKKDQYGDPATLPQVLASAQHKLTPILRDLELTVPETTLESLSAGLSAARQAQLERVSVLTKQAGELLMLKQSHEQAAETSWYAVREQKAQWGDPTELPGLAQAIHSRLMSVCQKLEFAQPGHTLNALESSLASARRAQPTMVGQLEQQISSLNTLKERYLQATVASWQGVSERKAQWGDPGDLPSLLSEIQNNLTSILHSLVLPTPQSTFPALEKSLADARRVLPGTIGKLERQAGQLSTLRERYQQASQEVVEDMTVPPGLIARRKDLQSRVEALNREIPTLTGALNELHIKQEQAGELRDQVKALPGLRTEIEHLQNELQRLEAVGKQGQLYNQVLDVGRQYLEQARPEHCPICKQEIEDLGHLLDTLRSESPADVEKMRQEFKSLKQQLVAQESQVSTLASRQKQLLDLEGELSQFPADLEQQIAQKWRESEQAADELAGVQAEITQIEGRIRLAAENLQRLQTLVQEIRAALGRDPEPDPMSTLEQATVVARQHAADLGAFDFQPIDDRLARARQLNQIEREEARLRRQVQETRTEVEKVLGPATDEEISIRFDQTTQVLRTRISEIQSLDFQPVADDLARARQLEQIQEEETRLRQELDAMQASVRQTLHLTTEETDLRAALERAIQDAQDRTTLVNALDLKPAEAELQRAAQLSQIQRDEAELRHLESNYQAANREKARLNHQIRRLAELREALLDIAETTKRHQETIVLDVLNNLDIHRYYQQLDPHPAYTQLQIEPEQTNKGTYNYWIKALTDDYAHGTYVQTRFSTAQENCAAIAIFLAVNQHLSQKLETLILDDPSQSMDPEHKQRLASTLAAIPRQIIIATEDPQMYGFLKDAFDAPKIHELTPWTTAGSRLT